MSTEQLITVLVNGNALDAIENDPQFGKNLARAIRANALSTTPTIIHAGCCINAATVAFQYPDDEVKVASIGFKHATILSDTISLVDHSSEQSKKLIIKDIVTKLGYYLRTKPPQWR